MVIESSYDNILLRRHKDILEKERVIEDFKVYSEHKDILKTSMAVCSVILGCNMVILDNNSFDDSLMQLKEVLNK